MSSHLTKNVTNIARPKGSRLGLLHSSVSTHMQRKQTKFKYSAVKMGSFDNQYMYK